MLENMASMTTRPNGPSNWLHPAWIASWAVALNVIHSKSTGKPFAKVSSKYTGKTWTGWLANIQVTPKLRFPEIFSYSALNVPKRFSTKPTLHQILINNDPRVVFLAANKYHKFT